MRLSKLGSCSLLFVLGWAVICCTLLSAQTAPDTFAIVALPDTQFYSKSYPSIFNAQTAWIANNARAKNIQLVLGLGDVVDAAGQAYQWQTADAAYRLLDGKVPYLAAIGNHDYDASDPSTRRAAAFNQWFGPARYSGQSWYRGNYPSGSNENFYGVFSISGHTYLVLVLELMPRNSTLQWAASVLQANLDKEVIVVTHAYMYWNNSRIGVCDSWNAQRMGLDGDNDGDLLWANFLKKYPNIILVLSGHVVDQGGVGRRSDLGDHGNLVNQMLSDYQSYTNGGDGYLRILTVTPSQNRIDVATYSPFEGTYFTDAKNQFTIPYRSTGATGNGALEGKVRSLADCTDVSSVAVSAAGASTITDTHGHYSIAGLAAGTWPVSAGKSNWIPASNTALVQSALTAYDKFFLAPAGQISGTVLTTSGTGIPGVTVTLSGGLLDVSKILTTDSAGRFSSGNVATGEYQLTFAAPGYGSTSSTATVSQGQTTTVSSSLVSTSDGSCSPPTKPGVNLCTPAAGATVASPVSVMAAAASTTTVSNMQLWVDGVKQYQVAGDRLSASAALSGGSHRVVALAVDAVGSILSQAVSVTVGGCPLPKSIGVQICRPSDGTTVTSPVAVDASALSGSTIKSLGIWVDGVKVYSIASDQLSTSLAMSPGTHKITVLSLDSVGMTAKSSVNVTISR